MESKTRCAIMKLYVNLIIIVILSVPYSIRAKDLTPRKGVSKFKAKTTTVLPHSNTTISEEKVKSKSFTNAIGQEFVWIESGSFIMGSPFSESYMDDEVSQRQVTLSKGFYMQTTEVTQGQWKAVMGTHPWAGKEHVRVGDNYAATYVSWNDAQEFIRKLNQKEGTRTYRLPTEAQWEYACRAGSTTAYSFGDSANRLGEYGWYIENTWNRGEKYAHKAGQKRSNSWGLYDMHGNVWEWCSGWYDDYSSVSVTDPEGSSKGSVRVYRGGSWNNSARLCRSADLVRSKPDFRFHSVGFRLIRIK